MEKERSYNKMVSPQQQIKYEFTNQDTIALRKSGKYWKAVGNSALILKIFGAKTKIRTHYDPFFSQEILEMSTHQDKLPAAKKYLEEKGATVLRDDKIFFVVRLKVPISSKVLKEAKNSSVVKKEITEDILLRYRHDTALGRSVRNIFTELLVIVRNLKSPEARVLGSALLEHIVSLQCMTRIYSRTTSPSSEIAQQIDDKADDILGLLLLLSNFVAHASQIAVIGRELNSIRLTMKDTLEA